MSTDATTTDGTAGEVPGREATTGANVPPGGGGPRRRRGREPEFRSYYDMPVINKPVWESPDIPGYFFLGGLAGASAAVAVCSDVTGRPVLARVSKVAAAAGGQLSMVALIHDLGRRGRFVNMLRVFKPTSPMSVGSWLLAGFVPAASVAAASAVTGRARLLGALATTAAAALGLPVATYTAALMADTAVPAWHEGAAFYPFIFVSSAAASASGLGLLLAPASETGPLVVLGSAGALGEVVLSKLHERHVGMVGEAFHEGKAGRYTKLAHALTLSGALVTAAGRRSRLLRAAGGALMLSGSAFTRFGIFEAGLVSAEDPRYTVVPQRKRLEERRSGPA